MAMTVNIAVLITNISVLLLLRTKRRLEALPMLLQDDLHLAPWGEETQTFPFATGALQSCRGCEGKP